MKKLKFAIVPLILLSVILIAGTSVRSARLVSRLTISENLVTPTTSTFIEINGLDEAVVYQDGGVRNDADNVWADTVLNDGTIDLTALTNSLGESLSLSGQVVVAAKFFLADSTGKTCTISNGASNSYPLFGTTYSLQLQANQSLLFKADTVLIPIDATHKNITYNSSDNDTPLYIIIMTADGYN